MVIRVFPSKYTWLQSIFQPPSLPSLFYYFTGKISRTTSDRQLHHVQCHTGCSASLADGKEVRAPQTGSRAAPLASRDAWNAPSSETVGDVRPVSCMRFSPFHFPTRYQEEVRDKTSTCRAPRVIYYFSRRK